MAQNEDDLMKTRPVGSPAGRWLRVAIIGRNPRFTLARIVALVVICVVVFKLVLLPIRVDGISMFPTYKDRSVNFVNRLAYLWHEPSRADVVGIRLGGTNVFYRAPGVMYMKRIIGLPGETVAFADGRLLINGTPMAEPYMNAPYDWTSPPVVVGPNQYFVVGDNRSMAQRDHYHGKIEKERIVGKVLF